MTRAQKVAAAQRLRGQGLKHREIADVMGVAKSTVNSYFVDPDGSQLRARKDSYRGTCEKCGRLTDGSAGRANAPRHCLTCAPIKNRFWTEDLIIQKIREWADQYGQAPFASDWNVPLARRRFSQQRAAEIAKRYEDGYWPQVVTVQERFGSWNAAIEAAGFAPRPAHRVKAAS